MNKDLEAILVALEKNGDQPGDIDKARQLSTKYVQAHPDEFAGFQSWGTGQAAIELCVKAVETFRAAYRTSSKDEDRENWARAEAWHFHTWEPQNIGGVVAPTIRNILN
jgi:hypothetical protein